MNSIFVFITLFTASLAQVILPYGPLRQHRSQDILGQYSYGYNDGLSTKQEIRGFDGSTRGSYSYIDANGKIQTVDYVADAFNGFRVAGTNLPKPVPVEKRLRLEPVRDTLEVAAAKKEHLKAVEDAKRGIITPPLSTPRLELPKPVEDTPEVKAAKVQHFAAKKNAELLARQPEIIVREPQLITRTPFARPLPLGVYGGWNSWNGYAPLTPYDPIFDYRFPLARQPLVYGGW